VVERCGDADDPGVHIAKTTELPRDDGAAQIT
jgi:hypothetical protein